MYSEELETLIDAALEDGELTEKEKQVLFKRAQAEGIDLDEFEMILDAKLVKLKKNNEAKDVEKSAPKSNKYGDVKKCPSCGSMVQSFQGVCPECGYAFEGLEANSSSKKLADKIDEIMKELSSRSDDAFKQTGQDGKVTLGTLSSNVLRSDQAGNAAKKRVQEVIKNFPIPNTKGDLMEFIITMKTNSQSGPFASAYFSKYTECVEKVKYLFPNDKDFAQFVSSYSKGGAFKRWWGSTSKLVKGLIIYGIIVVVALIIVAITRL